MAIRISHYCILILLNFSIVLVTAEKKLTFLHVVAVNKYYIPDYDYNSTSFELPKNLSYDHFVRNAVDLPNSVKMDLYKLGVHLRKTYSSFLNKFYTDEVIRMRTTEFPVSIIAGELINAGLWPPVGAQVWNEDLAWQPIPFEYRPAHEDTELLGSLCPRFTFETYSNQKSETQLLSDLNSNLNKSDINLKNLTQVPLLYYALENSVLLNQTLPAWANKTNLEYLVNVTKAAYDSLTKTKIQKLLNGGSLLKKIYYDSKNYTDGKLTHNRSIHVYSGDDRVFTGILKNLNIIRENLPDSAGALIFELYSEDKNHYIKIEYYTGNENETKPLKLDGCDSFCPIQNFSNYFSDILDLNEKEICYNVPVENDKASSTTLTVSNTLISISSAVIMYMATKIL